MPLGKPSFALAPAHLGAAGCALLFFLPVLRAEPPAGSARAFALSRDDERLLDEIERAGFRFFVEQSHPRTGLVRDRARADGSPSEGKASVASSGFSFGAWVIATERGWVQRAEAVERVRTKLRFLVDEAPRPHGFFYHFMEMDTGKRAWKCELSSMDSALVYAGAIVAREYFADPEITALVNRMLGDVDWNWFLNGGQQVALGWHDETGFSRYRWDHYSEHVLMSFLALGVSPQPLPAAYWQAWEREPLGPYADFVYVQEPPLFVHQFPQAYLDLRGRRDAVMDYFRNSQLATLAQRQMSIDLQSEFPRWGENLWGLAASDSATGYKAWGGPPRTLRFNALDGTIVPCAPAGSLPFEPEKTLAVLHNLKSAYGDRIWKRYGFVDAFNPHNGWVNTDVIGIDQGISLLQAENVRTGLIWRLFMQSPEARLSLAKAGFLSHARDLDGNQQAEARARAKSAWQTLQAHPASAGLQLTALLAARQLGFVTGDELLGAARPLLAAGGTDDTYAAALITLRQMVPALGAEATRLLDAFAWRDLPAAEPTLGASSRLGVFLQVAVGVRPAADWSHLPRPTQPVGPVQVLAPADPAGAVLPGLWLDERSLLSGASAAQLAYASLTGQEIPLSPLLPVLQLDQFPREALAAPARLPGTPEAAAAYVIATANLLAHDGVRAAFQKDALVQAGRAAIGEFAEAAFGANTSVYAQRELAGGDRIPPPRRALAVAHSLPREQWSWQTVAGLEFKDSNADIRPGDAPLSFRFAVTWDDRALHFRAEVTDTPAGYAVPPERNRLVELYVDPDGDGLAWTGSRDYQFTYRLGAGVEEQFNHVPSDARITPTAEGYTVEASIPWASLGLAPRPGLEFGLTPAAVTEGVKEWEATLKLNWSYAVPRPGEFRLGLVRLQ